MNIIQSIKERLPEVEIRRAGKPDVKLFKNKSVDSLSEIQNKSASNLIRHIASNVFNLFPLESYEGNIWKHNTHVWVYRCIRVLVNAATRVEPRQFREYVQNGIRKQEQLPYDHPAVTILSNPNLDDTIADLIEKIFTSWHLTGIYFLAYEEKQHELWHLRSDRVTIIPSETEFIERFDYQVGGETPISYPKENIVYDKFYNPNHDYIGLSPLQAAANSINSHMRAQKWNLHFFQNSAVPMGLLVTDYHFQNQAELDVYAKEWKKLYGGWEKAGSVATLGSGLDYKPLSPTHTDMAFGELLDKARDEISSAFGIPSIFLNDSNKANYANLREYERMLWRSTMIPLLLKIEQTFNKYLNQRFASKGEYIRTKFDLSQVEALHEDVVKEAEASRILCLSGQRRINEAREKRGEPPDPDGDVSLVPMSMVRLEQAGEVLGGKIPATGQTPKMIFKSIRPTRQERLKHWMTTKDFVVSNERKLIRILTAIFTDWQEEILRNLKSGKSAKEYFDVDSIMFDAEGAKVQLARAGGPIIEDSVEKGGKRVLASIESTIIFDIHDPRVDELITTATQRFAERIAGGHWERMKTSLVEGVNKGETVKELSERVRQTMGREINNAPTVARTEINPRYQEGQLEGMRQSGVVEQKEWLAAFTDTSRDEHIVADGQKVGLDDYYEVGGEYLQYPGDPSGSASNIINCLCDQLSVIAEE